MTVLQEKINGKPVKTKDGRSWFFKTNYADLEGNRKQFKSKKYELKSQALEAERTFLLTLTDKIHNNDMTFKDLILEFDNFKKNSVKITTYNSYKKYYDNMSLLSKVKLKDFNINIFNNWKNGINKLRISTTTKNNNYKFLRAILNYAIKFHNFNFNNVLGKMNNFDNPNEFKKEMLIWENNEYEEFIKEEKDIRYKALFEVLYFCGLRKGEANALNWNDVDFENNTININKNVALKIKGKKYILIPPKTKNSIRILPLSQRVINDLKELLKYYKEYNNFTYDWFIFGGICPLPETTIEKHKNNCCKKADVKQIRIHDFRHSCASLLISKGANVYLVSRYLGHNNINTTLNTYAHLFKNDLKELVKELDKL